MKSTLITDQQEERTYLLVFEIGDQLPEVLIEFAEREHIQTARIEAIGGFREATLGYYDLAKKEYEPFHITDQVELVSLLGNIAIDTTKPEHHARVHMHAIVAARDGSTRAGHVISAIVRPTVEMFIRTAPLRTEKKYDPQTGLPLFHL